MSSPDTTSIDVNKALWFCIAASVVFVFVIWLTGELWLTPPQFAPIQEGAIMPRMWYLWQRAEPTVWTRFSVWGLYTLHQVSMWYLIWKAQTGDYGYSKNLHWFNVAALGVNALFIFLHLVQTHVWYDGLAQDVPEVTSQASVVIVLVAILIMENQRRGMFFGYKLPFLKEAGSAIRKYHGYYFSWAILYTFWYHPMEINAGHLLGFMYMFLLMIQSSLFFTRMHVNPRWTIFAEVSVVLHGVVVAILAGQEWPRFFGGFLGMLVITQMHGLGLSKTVRWILGLAYVASIFVVYTYTQGIEYFYEAGLIPFAEFVMVIMLSIIVLILCRVFGYRQPGEAA